MWIRSNSELSSGHWWVNVVYLRSVIVMLFCQWSEEACAAHLTQRDGYQATTQCQLKDQLYQEIINYFDKGKVTTTNNKLLSQNLL